MPGPFNIATVIPPVRQLTVVVTGSTRGLGFAIAQWLVHHDATVVVTGRRQENVDRTAARLLEEGPGRALGITCDVTRPDSVQHLLDAATKELSVVHAMVANAGVATLARFLDLSLAEWEEIMRVNARGVFLCGQIFARHMLEHGGGRIVNISSQAGHQGQALVAHYCASKAAILGLTKAMALELAPHVQVNAVCPGIVETDMIAADFRRQSEILGLDAEEVARRTLARIPLGHFQSATSVAATVAFLLSAAAADITGQVIHVNGGMTTC